MVGILCAGFVRSAPANEWNVSVMGKKRAARPSCSLYANFLISFI